MVSGTVAEANKISASSGAGARRANRFAGRRAGRCIGAIWTTATETGGVTTSQTAATIVPVGRAIGPGKVRARAALSPSASCTTPAPCVGRGGGTTAGRGGGTTAERPAITRMGAARRGGVGTSASTKATGLARATPGSVNPRPKAAGTVCAIAGRTIATSGSGRAIGPATVARSLIDTFARCGHAFDKTMYPVPEATQTDSTKAAITVLGVSAKRAIRSDIRAKTSAKVLPFIYLVYAQRVNFSIMHLQLVCRDRAWRQKIAQNCGDCVENGK